MSSIKSYENIIKYIESGGFNSDVLKENKDILCKYFEDGGVYKNWETENIGKLNNLYNKRLEYNKNKIEKELVIDNISDIITPISFSKPGKNIIDELPIEKSLKIFKGIKRVYLICTDDTYINGNELRKKIKNKNSKIDIILDKFDEDGNNLRKLQKKYKFNKENTIIDITLGMKINSILLYKFAVESDIKVINWKEPYMQSIKKIDGDWELGLPFRVSLITTLELMKQPIRESIKNKNRMNENLKRWNFKEVAYYYGMSGREDYKEIFEYLSKMLNLDILFNLDFEQFKKEGIKTLSYLLKWSLNNDKDTEMFGDLIFLLTLITKSPDELAEIYEKISNCTIGEDEKYCEVKKEEDILDFICDSYAELYDEVKTKTPQLIFIELLLQFVKRNISRKKKGNFENLYRFLKLEEGQVEALNIISFRNSSIMDLILRMCKNLEDNFTESIDNFIIKIYNCTLQITKFNIELDLYSYFDGYFNSNRQPKKDEMKMLYKLIDIFDSMNYPEEINIREITDVSENTINKKKSQFNNTIIKPLNDIIKEKYKNGKEKLEFIILDKDMIKINPYFYDYNE